MDSIPQWCNSMNQESVLQHAAVEITHSAGSADQHCCQTPSVAVIGLQCHIQPSGRRAAPMFEVSSLKECVPSPDPDPDEPTRFVEVFVASLAKVPMMSEAKQTQSPSWSR